VQELEQAMKPGPFVYHAPRTVEQALAVLAEVAPNEGRVLAGGQSLVPAMALRLALPAHLVDINGVADFPRLGAQGGMLTIGACTRHAAFHRPVVDGPLGRILSVVVGHIAHYPIRTRGTFCGSLANADPASEWCVLAAVLGAKMVARSVRGTRTIPAAEFFQGMMATALAADEMLVSVSLPVLPADTRCGFYEFNRRPGDFAIAMALAAYRVEGGVIVDPRVGIGGVEAAPRRLAKAEQALAGRAPSDEVFRAAADIAAAEADPIDTQPELSRYKREIAGTAVHRALASADKSL
jgi:carbon-monoxide dehydrogenase medium subunit